jgi:hypothetical protein
VYISYLNAVYVKTPSALTFSFLFSVHPSARSVIKRNRQDLVEHHQPTTILATITATTLTIATTATITIESL